MTRALARTALALSALVLAGSAAPAAAVSKGADSLIDAVTIYPGGVAEIERRVPVSLRAGDQTVSVGALEPSLVEGSVRARVARGEGVRLGGAELRREPVGEAPREREAALEKRLREVEAERAAAKDAVAAAKTELRFIEGLAGLPEREGAPEFLAGAEAAKRWPALWTRLREGASGARAAIRDGEAEAERLERERKAVREKLAELGKGVRRETRVRLPLRAERAGEAELGLRYRVQGPQWSPVYAARLDTEAGRVVLLRRARVRQATGVDWEGVRLALATTRPVSGDLPRPSTWWTDFARSEREPELADADRKQLDALGYATAGRPAAPSAETVSAEFAARYRIPGRVDVPGSNAPRTLQIGGEALAAELGARLAPQQDRRAWLTAEATWEGEGTLPTGALERFRDGAFIGEGRLAAWPPGEARTLGFGTDPALAVRFERVEDEAGASGLLETWTTRRRRYALEVTNRHERALPLSTLFRLPVPRNEEIRVEPHFGAPPDERDVEDRRGVHRWTRRVEAGGTLALELGFDVSYPEGRSVPGF